jgi:hypothetical protein
MRQYYAQTHLRNAGNANKFSTGSTPFPALSTFTWASNKTIVQTTVWDWRWNDDGTYALFKTSANGAVWRNTVAFGTPYRFDVAIDTLETVGSSGSIERNFDWNSDGTAIITGDVSSTDISNYPGESLMVAYNPTAVINAGLDTVSLVKSLTPDTHHRSVQVLADGTKVLVCSNNGTYPLTMFTLSTADLVSSATLANEWDPTERVYYARLQADGLGGYASYDKAGVISLQRFTLSTAYDISSATWDGGTILNLETNAAATPMNFNVSPDGTSLIIGEWSAAAADQFQLWT